MRDLRTPMRAFSIMGALLVPGQLAAQTDLGPTAKVDGAYIRNNETSSKEWPTIGLDYAETRHSKLAQINDANVKDLGLAWSYNLESTRGVEATPLVVDGVMYVSASWSIVHAIDVRTGNRLWVYDPKVPRELGFKGCCDVVNRGVAVHKGKVYVGAYDGRLIAIDAGTGKLAWEKDTLIDRRRPYTITGAPRVYKGNVVIGNGGAEYGVRGYVTAYDAETPAPSSGAGSPCRVIRASPSKTSRWRRPPRPGILPASTGKQVAAVPLGIR